MTAGSGPFFFFFLFAVLFDVIAIFVSTFGVEFFLREDAILGVPPSFAGGETITPRTGSNGNVLRSGRAFVKSINSRKQTSSTTDDVI
jgi:hypothetical protein